MILVGRSFVHVRTEKYLFISGLLCYDGNRIENRIQFFVFENDRVMG
mgnify:CR=1 FL=1